jgi:PPP family 3-phenylpropionic acid transporter
MIAPFRKEKTIRLKNKTLIWPFIFYFIISASAAAYRPYLVLYFQSINISGAQIGLLVGIIPLFTMVSIPFMTGLADKTNMHGSIMSLSLLLIGLSLLLFPYLKSFSILISVTILISIFLSPIFPLTNSAAMLMLGQQKHLFGRIRLGGTIGFSIAAIIAGLLVENYGYKIAFWSAGILYIIAIFVNQKLIHNSDVKVNLPNKEQITDLLKNSRFMLLLLIGFAGGISYSANSTFLFPYLSELNAGEAIMGLTLTIGTIAEIPVLFFVSYFIKRFKAFNVLIFSTVMISLRFLLMTISANPNFVLFIQLLHGFTHPLLGIAGVTYADEHAPKGFRATAQGLFNAITGGIGAAFGGFIGGLLLDNFGAKGVYLVFFLFVLVILGIVSLVIYAFPSEQDQYLPSDPL